jgi:hypothetical protein
MQSTPRAASRSASGFASSSGRVINACIESSKIPGQAPIGSSNCGPAFRRILIIDMEA